MADQLAHETEYRGKETIAKLQRFKLMVCGAGAIGSNLVVNLCRQGFCQFGVVDFDRVEQHNVGTQAFSRKQVGMLKTVALNELAFRETGIALVTHAKRLESSNIKILADADCVVDAFDNSASRRLVFDYCEANKIPCLHVGLDADYGEVCWNEEYRVPGDPPDTGDAPCDYPLARNIVLLAVAVASETLIDFATAGQKRSFDITLRDRQIRPRI